MDENVIPVGYYCYNDDGVCPYWSLDSNQHEMENGYCKFLGKGDWDMNKEKKWRRVYTEGREFSRKSVDEAERGELQSAEELGMYMSVLWDQVKECDVKYGDSIKETKNGEENGN